MGHGLALPTEVPAVPNHQSIMEPDASIFGDIDHALLDVRCVDDNKDPAKSTRRHSDVFSNVCIILLLLTRFKSHGLILILKVIEYLPKGRRIHNHQALLSKPITSPQRHAESFASLPASKSLLHPRKHHRIQNRLPKPVPIKNTHRLLIPLPYKLLHLLRGHRITH